MIAVLLQVSNCSSMEVERRSRDHCYQYSDISRESYPDRITRHLATKFDEEWNIAPFQNTRAQYLGRPEEFQALTEELRKEL